MPVPSVLLKRLFPASNSGDLHELGILLDAMLKAAGPDKLTRIPTTILDLNGVPVTRQILAGSGLVGGGPLSADVALAVGVINDSQHGARGGGSLHPIATTSVAGFMSPADRVLLDGLPGSIVSGTGAADRVTVWTSASNVTGYSSLTYLSGDTRLRLTNSDSSDRGPEIRLRKERGGETSAQGGDLLGGVFAEGRGGSAFRESSSIRFIAAENFGGSGSWASYIGFWTTPVMGSTSRERMQVTSGGDVYVGNVPTSIRDSVLAGRGLFVARDSAGATGCELNTIWLTSGTDPAVIRVHVGSGNLDAPGATLAGQLAAFGMTGYSAAGTPVIGSRAFIGLHATENWSGSAQGTHITFWTTPTGSTTPTEKMRLDGFGRLGINTTSVAGSPALHALSPNSFGSEYSGIFDSRRNLNNITWLATRHMREDSTAPGAGFGSGLLFELEGFTNNSVVPSAYLASLWANNQTDDTTSRNSTFVIANMWNGALENRIVISDNLMIINKNAPASRSTLRVRNESGSGSRGTSCEFSVLDGSSERLMFGIYADSTTNPTTDQFLGIWDWIAMNWRLQILAGGTVRPGSAGTQNLGDATYYWNDVSYKTLTDRGCLGWFDDGVELADGRRVSDTEALLSIQKHPEKKTVYGVPMLDYATLPPVVYKPAPIAEEDIYERDGHGNLKLLFRKGEKAGTDGAETTALLSIMIGAIRELAQRVAVLEKL